MPVSVIDLGVSQSPSVQPIFPARYKSKYFLGHIASRINLSFKGFLNFPHKWTPIHTPLQYGINTIKAEDVGR